jgi:outer membrane protein assembly factor BamD
MKKISFIISFFLFLLILNSCGFQRVLKSDDVDKKYQKAMQYYEEKDYSKALQLFDQLMTSLRATDKAAKVYYYYAYAYYYQQDYTLASYYFKRYTTNFPNTKEAEECAYMSAYCNYKNSPDIGLDQTSTAEAIKELQLFINIYPTSKRISECNDLIDKLREKLEKKDFGVAKMYFRMDDYIASIKSFNNILKEYPDTQHKEEILFYIFKSYHKFAKKSVEEKKKERYARAIIAYNEFVQQYPESMFLSEAKDLKARAQKEIDAKYNKDQMQINKTNKK